MSMKLARKLSSISSKILHNSKIRRSTPMARATSSGPARAAARIGTLVVVALVAIALLGLTLSAWRSIAPGYVGIVFDKANHNVTAGALEPGWAFINPFTQAIQQYPITIQTYSMVQKGTEG